MVGGSYQDGDGLFRQYGTSKAVPTTAGDFLSYGNTRNIEFTVDLTTLTTTPAIQANTTFIPSNVFIESVEIDVETAAVGGTSLSIGTMRTDRTTSVSNTSFINALVTASMTVGASLTLTGGSTSAGGLIGTTTSFTDNGVYLTATVAGTFSAGKAKVRIRYRGIGTITQ